jgi:hypothetical protein
MICGELQKIVGFPPGSVLKKGLQLLLYMVLHLDTMEGSLRSAAGLPSTLMIGESLSRGGHILNIDMINSSRYDRFK